jgi:hypothetical protein
MADARTTYAPLFLPIWLPINSELSHGVGPTRRTGSSLTRENAIRPDCLGRFVHLRNVEVVGSSPITSTPFDQRLRWSGPLTEGSPSVPAPLRARCVPDRR